MSTGQLLPTAKCLGDCCLKGEEPGIYLPFDIVQGKGGTELSDTLLW